MKTIINRIFSLYKRQFKISTLKMVEISDSFKDTPSMNTNFNYVLTLNPRVTSFHESISLSILSSMTSGNIIEIGCYLCYSSVLMASAFLLNVPK